MANSVSLKTSKLHVIEVNGRPSTDKPDYFLPPTISSSPTILVVSLTACNPRSIKKLRDKEKREEEKTNIPIEQYHHCQPSFRKQRKTKRREKKTYNTIAKILKKKKKEITTRRFDETINWEDSI